MIRPTLAQITGGPSGKLQSRDAKFTFSAGPEPGFGFSAEEVGAKFECRLTPRDAGFGACPANGYTGLADGSYRFEVRATDTGGTSAGTASVSSRSTRRRTHRSRSRRTRRWSAARSHSTARRRRRRTPIAKYEWDLDGNGSFETDTAARPRRRRRPIRAPGTFNDRRCASPTATARTRDRDAARCRSTRPAGPARSSASRSTTARSTRDSPDVTVTSTFPSFTTSPAVLERRRLRQARRRSRRRRRRKWKLDSSGPERLPKTIYVRFLTGPIAEPRPSRTTSSSTRRRRRSTRRRSRRPRRVGGTARHVAAKLRKCRVKVKATDSNSGVAKVQVTANKRKPGKALKYKRKLTRQVGEAAGVGPRARPRRQLVEVEEGPLDPH